LRLSVSGPQGKNRLMDYNQVAGKKNYVV
jgi:hypothetical protein